MFVVELRHTLGSLFDDRKTMHGGADKKTKVTGNLSLLEELAIIQDILDEIKKEVPYFELTLVIVSYKLAGINHTNAMLDNIRHGKEKYPHLISGFDLVNEEEFTKPIAAFMPEILAAQEDLDPRVKDMPCFFHAGETNKKDLHNLHDSVLLNTKRIGHGF